MTGANMLRARRLIRTTRKIIFANYLTLFGAVITGVVVFTAVFAPVIAPHDPYAQDIANQFQAPSWTHLMGTDQYGRDVFTRVLYGARISLQVGLLAVGIAVGSGVPLGLLSGYYGRYVDETIMRTMDIMFAFPAILLAITLMAILGQSMLNLIIAIGIVYTPIFARITRSEVLSVREEQYATAARAIGDRDFAIMTKDILPNVLAPIIVQATISIAFAILTEAALSFIGLGAPRPEASWGRMLSDARQFMDHSWWTAVFPGFAIMITILAINFIGDGIRDTLDPKHDAEAKGGY